MHRLLRLGTSKLRWVSLGEDMGLMYLKGVVGPKALYDVELTGMQY